MWQDCHLNETQWQPLLKITSTDDNNNERENPTRHTASENKMIVSLQCGSCFWSMLNYGIRAYWNYGTSTQSLNKLLSSGVGMDVSGYWISNKVLQVAWLITRTRTRCIVQVYWLISWNNGTEQFLLDPLILWSSLYPHFSDACHTKHTRKYHFWTTTRRVSDIDGCARSRSRTVTYGFSNNNRLIVDIYDFFSPFLCVATEHAFCHAIHGRNIDEN